MELKNDDGSFSSQARETDSESHRAIRKEVVKISLNSTSSSHQ